MVLSLKQFLQTGSLGQIYLGMPADVVLDLLGTPDYGDVTLQNERGIMWQYGTFMFGFGEAHKKLYGLTSIEWSAALGEAHFPSHEIEDWGITAKMPPAEVKAYLRDNGLKFHYRNSKQTGGLVLFLLSGVKIHFQFERLTTIVIYSCNL